MPLFKYILVSFFLITSANAWDLKDFKSEALSPFSTSARNVFYTGAGLTLSVLIFEDAIVDPTQREFVEDKPVGSLSRFGDLAGQMIPNALYVLGQTIAGVPALSLATLVGASRINDNRHYLHDVLAGATIGLVYGIGISKLDQYKRTSEIEEKSASLTIAPIFDGNTKGIALIKDF